MLAEGVVPYCGVTHFGDLVNNLGMEEKRGFGGFE